MNYEKGMLVRSLAGHDAGSLYIIIEETADAVLVANGREKTLAKTKKKKKKHVQLIKYKPEGITQRLADGKLTDADLVFAIRTYKENN